MNKLFIVLLLLVGSLNAMDANAGWREQIAREINHERILKLFKTDEFQRKKLKPAEIIALVEQLQDLRSTAGYVGLNEALLGLAKKSTIFGKLGDELEFARILMGAGAMMRYHQDAAMPYSGPLIETGVAPIGYKVKLRKESSFCLAKGDLRDLFDRKEAEESPAACN